LAQTGKHLFHSLARCRFAADDDARIADAEDATSRVRECDAAEEQVRPPRRGMRVSVQLSHDAIPRFPLEEGDLSPSTAIDVPRETPTFDELRFLDRVHHAAVRALDPDGLELARSVIVLVHA
jgi:hypothetical protein